MKRRGLIPRDNTSQARRGSEESNWERKLVQLVILRLEKFKLGLLHKPRAKMAPTWNVMCSASVVQESETLSRSASSETQWSPSQSESSASATWIPAAGPDRPRGAKVWIDSCSSYCEAKAEAVAVAATMANNDIMVRVFFILSSITVPEKV